MRRVLTAGRPVEVLGEIEDYSENILYYLAFLIVLEFALRLLMGVAQLLGGDDGAAAPQEPELPPRRGPLLLLGIRRRSRFTVRRGVPAAGAGPPLSDDDPAAR